MLPPLSTSKCMHDLFKTMRQLGVVVHTFNFSSWEVEAGGSLWLSGQLGLQGSPTSKRPKRRELRGLNSVQQLPLHFGKPGRAPAWELQNEKKKGEGRNSSNCEKLKRSVDKSTCFIMRTELLIPAPLSSGSQILVTLALRDPTYSTCLCGHVCTPPPQKSLKTWKVLGVLVISLTGFEFTTHIHIPSWPWTHRDLQSLPPKC